MFHKSFDNYILSPWPPVRLFIRVLYHFRGRLAQRPFLDLVWRRQEATIGRGELRIGVIDHLLQIREDLELHCFHYFCYFCYLFYLSIIQTIITMCFMNMSEQSLLLDLGFSNRLINVILTQQLLGCLEIQFNHLVMLKAKFKIDHPSNLDLRINWDQTIA